MVKKENKIKCSGMEVDVIICPEGNGKNRVYSINAVQVPNVVTQGKTVEEAKKRLKEALTLYLEDLPQLKKEVFNLCKEEAPMISRIFL